MPARIITRTVIGSALQTTNSVDNPIAIILLFFILSSSPFIHHYLFHIQFRLLFTYYQIYYFLY